VELMGQLFAAGCELLDSLQTQQFFKQLDAGMTALDSACVLLKHFISLFKSLIALLEFNLFSREFC
jgi:hypothetical protein